MQCNIACPICRCDKTYGIRIELLDLDVGDAIGYYRGCPACQWASSMTVSAEELEEFPYNKLDLGNVPGDFGLDAE